MRETIIKQSVTLPLLDAVRVFTAVGMFASTDKDRHYLRDIRIQSEDGKLVIMATDSFALAKFTATEWAYTGEAFSLPAVGIVKILAAYTKTYKVGDVTITPTDDRYTVTVTANEGRSSMSGDIVLDDFPNVDTLLAAATGTSAPFIGVGFGGAQLARLGKCATKFSTAAFVLRHYNGARKPLLFTQTDDIGVLTVLQMPETVKELEGE